MRANFRREGAFNPASTRAAISELTARVLLYGGELDADPAPEALAAAARLFPNATLTVQPGAGHFPWVDDPDLFAASVSSFLT